MNHNELISALAQWLTKNDRVSGSALADALEEAKEETAANKIRLVLGVLGSPLTEQQIEEQTGEGTSYVEGVIRLGTSDLIERDLDGVLDLMSDGLVGGQGYLSDISYEVVGTEGDEILLLVSGEVVTWE